MYSARCQTVNDEQQIAPHRNDERYALHVVEEHIRCLFPKAWNTRERAHAVHAVHFVLLAIAVLDRVGNIDQHPHCRNQYNAEADDVDDRNCMVARVLQTEAQRLGADKERTCGQTREPFAPIG